MADVGGSGLVIGLSVAIGVFGFILLLSVVAYCMLRRHLGRRRLNSDHQELSLQGPMIEVVSQWHKRVASQSDEIYYL